jgi:hypothetical protein
MFIELSNYGSIRNLVTDGKPRLDAKGVMVIMGRCPLPTLMGGVSTLGVSIVTPSLGVTKNPSKARI